MEIAYFGRGRLGSLCHDMIDRLGIGVVGPADYDKASFFVSVHWNEIWTKDQLSIPKEGCLNLHNSYLPWNKGAHACTWAIVDQTPHGATMHWMDEGIDTGDIFHRERLQLREGESADELYQRTMELEVKVFRDSMKMLLDGKRPRTPQVGIGSVHRKRDFERLVNAVKTSDCVVVRR